MIKIKPSKKSDKRTKKYKHLLNPSYNGELRERVEMGEIGLFVCVWRCEPDNWGWNDEYQNIHPLSHQKSNASKNWGKNRKKTGNGGGERGIGYHERNGFTKRQLQERTGKSGRKHSRLVKEWWSENDN